MPSTASLSLNDYDGQAGIIGYNVPEVTSANIVDTATKMGAFRTAVEAITIGETIKSELSIIARFSSSNAKATDPLAQRGNKWMVSFRDMSQFLDGANTVPNPGYQKSFTLDIPTADLSFRTSGQDIVWSAGVPGNPAEFNALVVAMEDLLVSPYNGVILVEQIMAVTRAGG